MWGRRQARGLGHGEPPCDLLTKNNDVRLKHPQHDSILLFEEYYRNCLPTFMYPEVIMDLYRVDDIIGDARGCAW
eukprot:scaffold10650_cov169-Amphora_coffeaeformis.AAC.9